MKNYARHITIINANDKEPVKAKPQAKAFLRRKAFVDPTCKWMRYNNFKTYAENKQDYYNTIGLVYSGKCKNIFEAYKVSHCC